MIWKPNLIIEICKSSSKIQHIKMRPGEIPGSVVKADTRTLQCLDYSVEQMIQMPEGLRKTVEWYSMEKP